MRKEYLKNILTQYIIPAVVSLILVNLIVILERTLDIASQFLSLVSSTYADSIYHSASKVTGFAYHMKIPALIIFISGVWLANKVLMTWNKKKKAVPKKSYRYFQGALGVVLSILGYFMVAHADAVQRVQTDALTNLEIIRPYVGEQDYLILKSDFHRANNKERYDYFDKQLSNYIDIANKKFKEIKLPQKDDG